VILEYNTAALQLFAQSSYEEALHCLEQAEDILEAVATQGFSIAVDFVLVTMHNLAVCYQQ
jgi:hypothetical protein